MKNKIANKLILLVAVLFLVGGLLLPIFVFAHPGGLDKSGCHTCKKNCAQYGLQDGEYHCHKNSSTSSDSLNKKQPEKNPSEIAGFVSSVVDGDTVYVMINKKRYKVRLIGIDAPEMKNQNKQMQCLAKESKKYLEQLIKYNSVTLKPDIQGDDQDKYGRILRYVYLDGILVNSELIKNGYAYAYTRFLFQYKKEFEDFGNQARKMGLGIWGGSRCFGKKSKK